MADLEARPPLCNTVSGAEAREARRASFLSQWPPGALIRPHGTKAPCTNSNRSFVAFVFALSSLTAEVDTPCATCTVCLYTQEMTAATAVRCPDVAPARDSAIADNTPLLRALGVGDIVSLIYRQLSWVECLSVSKALGHVAPLTVTRVPLFRSIVARQLKRLHIDGESFLRTLNIANYSLSGSFLLHCLLVPTGDPGSYSAVFTDKSDLDVFCLPSNGPHRPCQMCAQRTAKQPRALFQAPTELNRSAKHLHAANHFTEFLCSIAVSERAGSSAYGGLGFFASPALIAAANWDLGTVSLQVCHRPCASTAMLTSRSDCNCEPASEARVAALVAL